VLYLQLLKILLSYCLLLANRTSWKQIQRKAKRKRMTEESNLALSENAEKEQPSRSPLIVDIDPSTDDTPFPSECFIPYSPRRTDSTPNSDDESFSSKIFMSCSPRRKDSTSNSDDEPSPNTDDESSPNTDDAFSFPSKKFKSSSPKRKDISFPDHSFSSSEFMSPIKEKIMVKSAISDKTSGTNGFLSNSLTGKSLLTNRPRADMIDLTFSSPDTCIQTGFASSSEYDTSRLEDQWVSPLLSPIAPTDPDDGLPDWHYASTIPLVEHVRPRLSVDMRPLHRKLVDEKRIQLTKSKNKSRTIFELSKILISRETFLRLHNEIWLNDEIINFYFALLQMRHQSKGYFFWHSFFYSKLWENQRYCYQNVKSWTGKKKMKINIFTLHKIFIPIFLNVHWTLVMVDMTNCNVQYFDSSGSNGTLIMDNIFHWIKDEARERKTADFDGSKWKKISHRKGIPQQTNDFDCGVFTICCASYLSDDFPLTFTQSEMQQFRDKISYAIMTSSLVYL
jgi:hypothetical protein